MNSALSKAFAATGEEKYRELALRNMKFLLHNYAGPGPVLQHTWKNGQAKYPAFLDDYSFLIAALVELAQVTADYSHLQTASELTEKVLELYSDEASPFFFFTYKGQKDIIVPKKEIYDGATPSGNAVMAGNLYRLSILFDKPSWRERAENMVQSLGEVAVKYPTSFGVWLALYYEMSMGTVEIAIVGKDAKKYLEKILSVYISHKLAQASDNPLPRYPLLADKAETSEILIYLCKNYACRQPVSTIQGFLSLLQSK
jgi:uncharacterized protein YyaL (SSP411 family)